MQFLELPCVCLRFALLKNAAKKVKLDGRHENHTEISTIPAAKPPTRSSTAVSKPAAAKPPALTKKTSQVKGATGRGAGGTVKATGAGKVTAGAKNKAAGRLFLARSKEVGELLTSLTKVGVRRPVSGYKAREFPAFSDKSRQGSGHTFHIFPHVLMNAGNCI